MPVTIPSPVAPAPAILGPQVRPSTVDSTTAVPFTLDQELEVFGSWIDAPIWVPPKKSNKAMAQFMLDQFGPMVAKDKRWDAVIGEFKSNFTQIREIDLVKASIRLPKGKFYVSVTEQEDFEKISDPIPACVQTRLDEFLEGPGKKPGVKVYYLKPLCVEVGDELILTTREDLVAAIQKIKNEVFSAYRQMYLARLPKRLVVGAINLALALPRGIIQHQVGREQRKIDSLHAKLEFQRRKTALRAAKAHLKSRTDGCTFDEMLALTNPLEMNDVIGQYAIEEDLSRAKREQLMHIAAGSIPWFVSMSLTVSVLVTLAKVSMASPVMVCDPVFVAEMPDAPGTLLKIGHFDEVGGIVHIEI